MVINLRCLLKQLITEIFVNNLSIFIAEIFDHLIFLILLKINFGGLSTCSQSLQKTRSSFINIFIVSLFLFILNIYLKDVLQFLKNRLLKYIILLKCPRGQTVISQINVRNILICLIEFLYFSFKKKIILGGLIYKIKLILTKYLILNLISKLRTRRPSIIMITFQRL